MSENLSGSDEQGKMSRPSKLTVSRWSRGQVPVFKRPNCNPKLRKERLKSKAGASPALPPGKVNLSKCRAPAKKVPVHITIALHSICKPERVINPFIKLLSDTILATVSEITVTFSAS